MACLQSTVGWQSGRGTGGVLVGTDGALTDTGAGSASQLEGEADQQQTGEQQTAGGS